MHFVELLCLIATFLAGFVGVYGALWLGNRLFSSRADKQATTAPPHKREADQLAAREASLEPRIRTLRAIPTNWRRPR